MTADFLSFDSALPLKSFVLLWKSCPQPLLQVPATWVSRRAAVLSATWGLPLTKITFEGYLACRSLKPDPLIPAVSWIGTVSPQTGSQIAAAPSRGCLCSYRDTMLLSTKLIFENCTVDLLKNYPSFSPGTHRVEGQKWCLQVVLWPPYSHCDTGTPSPYWDKWKMWNKNGKIMLQCLK